MKLNKLKQIIKEEIQKLQALNEIQMATMASLSSGGVCRCKCPAGYGTPTLGQSTFTTLGLQNSVQECIKVCGLAPCEPLEGGTTTSADGLGKDDLGIEPIKSPSKPVKKPFRAQRPVKAQRPKPRGGLMNYIGPAAGGGLSGANQPGGPRTR